MADYTFNAELEWGRLVRGIREEFETGKLKGSKGAVLGISGGKDSTILGYALVQALGRDRVLGVVMPYGVMRDFDTSMEVIEFLGIRHVKYNIFDSCYGLRGREDESGRRFFEVISTEGEVDRVFESEGSRINLPPRIRKALLYYIGQSIGYRVICTSNLSEEWVGYTTKGGDNFGDFAPGINYTCSEIVAMGKAMEIPYKFVSKAPDDGLCGVPDEQRFGFLYSVLDKYIRTGKAGEDVANKIDRMYFGSRHKFDLMPRIENSLPKHYPVKKFDFMLKTEGVSFEDIRSGRKAFECRKNDRDYSVGKVVRLLKMEGDKCVDEFIDVEITYVLKGGDFEVPDEYVVMGIRKI